MHKLICFRRLIILTGLFFFLPADVPLFAQGENLVEIDLQQGDTLRSFATRYLKKPGYWKKIRKYNKGLKKKPDKPLSGMKLTVPAKLMKEQVGHIIFAEGMSLVQIDGKGWKNASLGTWLVSGDGIMTAANSQVILKLPVKGILKIAESTLIYLGEDEAGGIKVKMTKGGIKAEDGGSKISGGGTEIDPSDNAEFRVSIKKEDVVRVSVQKEKVRVTAAGKTVVVPEKYGTQISYNAVPAKPLPLPKGYFDKRVLEKKEFFHLQVAQDTNFNRKVKDETVKTLEKLKSGLPPGVYWWRAAVIDKDGFRSEFSSPSCFVVASPGYKGVSITSILKLSENMLRITGSCPGVDFIMVNGYFGTIDALENFVVEINVKNKRLFTITTQGKDTIESLKFFQTPEGSWVPLQ